MHGCLSVSVSIAETKNLWRKVTAGNKGVFVPGLFSRVLQKELLCTLREELCISQNLRKCLNGLQIIHSNFKCLQRHVLHRATQSCLYVGPAPWVSTKSAVPVRPGYTFSFQAPFKMLPSCTLCGLEMRVGNRLDRLCAIYARKRASRRKGVARGVRGWTFISEGSLFDSFLPGCKWKSHGEGGEDMITLTRCSASSAGG